MIHCPHCDQENRDGARFCAHCGAELLAAEPPAVAEPSPAWSPPFPNLPITVENHFALMQISLIQIDEQDDDFVIYQAQDWRRCWQCNGVRSDLQDPFCPHCGVEIDHGLPCRARVGSAPPDADWECVTTQDNVSLWIQSVPRDPPPASDPALLRLRAGYATHPGQVRAIDEDSLLVLIGATVTEGRAAASLGLFAVADGMGGHDDGQVASRRVIQVLATELVSQVLAPTLSGKMLLLETLPQQVSEAVQEANRSLTREAHETHKNMGSTLTLALIYGRQAIIANVGDSRTYLWRDGILHQITRDHSTVARLVEKGELHPADIYAHPQRSEVYRMMGDKPELEIDVWAQDVQVGDRLVLCCDGVWETARDDGIERALLSYPLDAQAVCDELVEQANLAGGDDNISVIVVDVV